MLAYLLIISAAIHFMFSRFHVVVRLIVDIALCIILGISFSQRWQKYADSIDLTLGQKLAATFADAWQFYTIGFCILLIARLVLYAVHTRLQLSLFTTLGLILVLIVDSFSPIVLWPHAIVLVCLFLLWHMCWHYEQIRKGNKEEFEVLFYSPASIFTPFAAVLSIAIVLALLLPYGPPLLEDPYALWKKSRGEEVPAFLGDKGFKSVAESSKNKQSGYSRSSEVLGGGFNFNYETVMEIFTPQKSYWRGETINYYNGKGWIDTLEQDIASPIMPQEKLPFLTSRPLAELKDIEVNVRVLSATPYPVLFHPNEPKQIKEVVYALDQSLFSSSSTPNTMQAKNTNMSGSIIYNEERMESPPGVKQLQKDNTITFDREGSRISYPIAYSVTSEVLVLDTEKLVLAEARHEDSSLHTLYTALPPELPQEVKDLATLITSEAKSDYERAKLIENYLKLNYAYDNQPNEERITGEQNDFVYNFLFELYEGYCDYFSTAMAVMAKSLGMPARWVKGFSSGVNLSEQISQQVPMSFEDAEQIKFELSGGTYNVRNADAHSWVEIYFEGYGWIAFEPTPGFSYPYEYMSEDSELAQLEALEPPAATVDSQDVHKQGTFSFSNLLYIIISTLLVLVIAVAILKREAVIGYIVGLRYKHLSNNEQIVYQFNAFLRYCERRGYSRAKAATVHEALLSWKRGNTDWRNQLQELYSLFEMARYSSKQLDADQVQNASKLIKKLKKQWYA